MESQKPILKTEAAFYIALLFSLVVFLQGSFLFLGLPHVRLSASDVFQAWFYAFLVFAFGLRLRWRGNARNTWQRALIDSCHKSMLLMLLVAAINAGEHNIEAPRFIRWFFIILFTDFAIERLIWSYRHIRRAILKDEAARKDAHFGGL